MCLARRALHIGVSSQKAWRNFIQTLPSNFKFTSIYMARKGACGLRDAQFYVQCN